MDTIGERFDRGAGARVHPRRHLEKTPYGHRRGAREAAGPRDAEKIAIRTEVAVAALAVRAPAAADDRVDRHPLCLPARVDPRTEFGHRPRVLVAHDEGWRPVAHPAEVALHLGAADPGGIRLDDRLLRTRPGLSDVLDLHPLRPKPDQRFHAASPLLPG